MEYNAAVKINEILYAVIWKSFQIDLKKVQNIIHIIPLVSERGERRTYKNMYSHLKIFRWVNLMRKYGKMNRK